MTPIQGLILGLVQGLTEFLPVSSSGHLVIVQHLFYLKEAPILFDTLVHLATALAVITVIIKTLIKLNFRQIKFILIASIPTGVIGIFLNQVIEELFSSLNLVGFSLIITSAILYSTKKQITLSGCDRGNTPQKSFLIGLAQALAIIPGISRSGSTISAGLHLGLSSKEAFDFSFLIFLPAIFAVQLLQLNKLGDLSSLEYPTLLIGFTSAFISGLLALKLLKRFVINGKLYLFSYYCLALALFTLSL